MKKMKVDISIIVPIYNAEKYIKECLDSILFQTKKELEIILVNDGSTDQTEQVIKEYNDPRIQYFKNENQGIGKTRNFGINKAIGEYLMFLDSDDYLEKDACYLLWKKAKEEDLDMVVCNFYKVWEEHKKEEIISPFETTSIQKKPKLLNIINMGPCNKIYKSSYIKENKIYFEENLKYEDTSFVIEAIEKANKIGQINEFLHNYRIHEQSETTIRDKRCFDILKVVAKMRNHLKGKEYLTEELDKWTIRIITNYTIQQRAQIDKKLGIEFIEKAFSYLQQEIPDYKDNKYYEGRGLLRRTIEKNQTLTKWYCLFYRWKKNRFK